MTFLEISQFIEEKNPADSTYGRLIALLDERRATYRLIDHAPEGRADIISPMRGNEPNKAAKCMIMIAKLRKKTTKYVLGVIPGDSD